MKNPALFLLAAWAGLESEAHRDKFDGEQTALRQQTILNMDYRKTPDRATTKAAIPEETRMNSSNNLPSHGAPLDPDEAEQARPGHGVPSQDPETAAQFPIEPVDAKREAHSVLTAGGAVGGIAIGAAIGAAVGGPLGVVVGGSLGAVAGALGGVAAGAVTNPGDARKPDPLTEEGVPAPTK